MSRRLILMRHAKSSWKFPELDDHQRPLNKRGKRDAPRMADALESRGWWPQRVLSSDAVRTLQTWARMAEGHPTCELVSDPGLYMAGAQQVQALARDTPDRIGTLLVLGHNPGWEMALTWLCGARDPMTTANAALLLSEAGTWQQAFESPGGFALEALLRPKELPPSSS